MRTNKIIENGKEWWLRTYKHVKKKVRIKKMWISFDVDYISWITSLEDLGAATCKLVNFVDHSPNSFGSFSKVLRKSFENPSEVLQKSFESPREVLQKSSTVVASVTDRQTHILTYGLLGHCLEVIFESLYLVLDGCSAVDLRNFEKQQIENCRGKVSQFVTSQFSK